MAKTRKTRERPNPVLPYTPITIRGVEYKMCFDLGALAEAEAHLLRQGYNVNLLAALPRMNLTTARLLFAASLYAYHPDIALVDAMALVSFSVLLQVVSAVADAWASSMPEPETEPRANPTTAAR